MEENTPWTILQLENGKYLNAPEKNMPVIAILKWSSGKQVPAVLKYVEKDDHSWVTADDDSELTHWIDVVKWMYLPKY